MAEYLTASEHQKRTRAGLARVLDEARDRLEQRVIERRIARILRDGGQHADRALQRGAEHWRNLRLRGARQSSRNASRGEHTRGAVNRW